MAEIELQRTGGGGGWWPWILGLVALVAVIWVVAEAMDDDAVVTDDMVAETELEPGPVAAAPAAETLSPEEARETLPTSVREYRETCAADAGPEDLGRQHEHTARCMELAATALNAAVRTDTIGSVVLEQELETFRSNAEELRASDPSALTHAPLVARTMDSAAGLVESLREQRYQDDDQLGEAAERLRELARDMEPETPLLEQRQRVHEFFQEMDRALRVIAR